MTRRRDDDGAAAVLGVQILTLLAVVTLVGVAVAALFLAHRRAQAAADLGALAGATAIQQGRPACPDAVRIAARNHGRVTSCVVAGDEVRLVVAVRTPSLLGRVRTMTATARAGPVR